MCQLMRRTRFSHGLDRVTRRDFPRRRVNQTSEKFHQHREKNSQQAEENEKTEKKAHDIFHYLTILHLGDLSNRRFPVSP